MTDAVPVVSAIGSASKLSVNAGDIGAHGRDLGL